VAASGLVLQGCSHVLTPLNEQATRWWDPAIRNEAGLRLEGSEIKDCQVTNNPYLIYECDRLQPEPIAFQTIDQGAFPEKAIATYIRFLSNRR